MDRSEILRLLQLRGLSSDALRWSGAETCKVTRHATNAAIDRSKFNSTTSNSDERHRGGENLEQVILNHLQQELGNTLHWKVSPNIPKEHVKTLTLRRNILGIAGGKPP